MNQNEFYTQWLAALRSGEYQQGVATLRHEDTYCCLGVACDIATKNGMGRWISTEHQNSRFVDDLMDPRAHSEDARIETGILTEGLSGFLGMNETGSFEIRRVDEVDWEDGEPEAAGENRPLDHWLTALNDDGFTFGQIADLIEYFFAPKSVSLSK